MLMNERIKSINNTINMLKCQIDICMNILESMINKEVMKECHEFINYMREKASQDHGETKKKEIWKFMADENRWPLKHSEWWGWKIQLNGTTVSSNEDPATTPPTTTNIQTTTSVNNNNRVKWVHNLSKTPLTEVQEKALAHGPNFAIVAKEPPVSEYISQIERVCQQLKQGKAEEVSSETKQIFKKIQPPKPNITKEEAKAIQELKRDKERIILTADKGVSMVVMGKEEYINKSRAPTPTNLQRTSIRPHYQT